jgi:hypothetical protein
LTAGVKRRLGLPEDEGVPPDVQRLVDSVATEVVENSVAAALVREIPRLTISFNGSSGTDGARTSRDLNVALQEAERLAAKKKALRVAGFSNDEAMRILVAEVTGRASQSER